MNAFFLFNVRFIITLFYKNTFFLLLGVMCFIRDNEEGKKCNNNFPCPLVK